MHQMNFAAKFCVCGICGQTWKLGKWGWNPVDPQRKYRGKYKKPYRRKPSYKKGK